MEPTNGRTRPAYPRPATNGTGPHVKAQKAAAPVDRKKQYAKNPTGAYVSSGMGWWGFGAAALDGAPYFTWLDIVRMQRDPRVKLIEAMWSAPFQKVKHQVKASSDSVSKFVTATIRKFWRRSLPGLLSRYWAYGYSAGGVEFSIKNGFLRLERVKPIECRDVYPRVYTDGPQRNQFAGFTIQSGTGATGQQPATPDPQNGVPVGHPHAFWFAGKARLGEFYDHPPLAGLFEPWLEKRGRNGAVHARRLWFRRGAWRGKKLYHPPGTTNLGTDEHPNVIDNQDLSRQLLDYAESGGTFTFENGINPGADGKYEWDLEDDVPQGDIAGFREYPKDLDREMLEGACIPPEVVESSESGSGYNGRMVPLQGFLGIIDELAGTVLESCEPWLKPCVEANFGESAWYEISTMSLAEQVEEEEKQKQQRSGQFTAKDTTAQQVPFALSATGDDPVARAVRELTARVDALANGRPVNFSIGDGRGGDWTRYQGPHGGHGWISSTGEVRYQDEMPTDDEGAVESRTVKLRKRADRSQAAWERSRAEVSSLLDSQGPPTPALKAIGAGLEAGGGHLVGHAEAHERRVMKFRTDPVHGKVVDTSDPHTLAAMRLRAAAAEHDRRFQTSLDHDHAADDAESGDQERAAAAKAKTAHGAKKVAARRLLFAIDKLWRSSWQLNNGAPEFKRLEQVLGAQPEPTLSAYAEYAPKITQAAQVVLAAPVATAAQKKLAGAALGHANQFLSATGAATALSVTTNTGETPQTKEDSFRATTGKIMRSRKATIAQLLALAMIRAQQRATKVGRPEEAAGSLAALSEMAGDPVQIARIIGFEMSALEREYFELAWARIDDGPRGGVRVQNVETGKILRGSKALEKIRQTKLRESGLPTTKKKISQKAAHMTAMDVVTRAGVGDLDPEDINDLRKSLGVLNSKQLRGLAGHLKTNLKGERRAGQMVNRILAHVEQKVGAGGAVKVEEKAPAPAPKAKGAAPAVKKAAPPSAPIPELAPDTPAPEVTAAPAPAKKAAARAKPPVPVVKKVPVAPEEGGKPTPTVAPATPTDDEEPAAETGERQLEINRSKAGEAYQALKTVVAQGGNRDRIFAAHERALAAVSALPQPDQNRILPALRKALPDSLVSKGAEKPRGGFLGAAPEDESVADQPIGSVKELLADPEIKALLAKRRAKAGATPPTKSAAPAPTPAGTLDALYADERKAPEPAPAKEKAAAAAVAKEVEKSKTPPAPQPATASGLIAAVKKGVGKKATAPQAPGHERAESTNGEADTKYLEGIAAKMPDGPAKEYVRSALENRTGTGEAPTHLVSGNKVTRRHDTMQQLAIQYARAAKENPEAARVLAGAITGLGGTVAGKPAGANVQFDSALYDRQPGLLGGEPVTVVTQPVVWHDPTTDMEQTLIKGTVKKRTVK